MRIALIKEDTVVNIAEFNHFFTAQEVAASLDFVPVNVDNLTVETGDVYRDGNFYRNGEPILQESDGELNQIATLQSEILEMGNILDSILLEQLGERGLILHE